MTHLKFKAQYGSSDMFRFSTLWEQRLSEAVSSSVSAGFLTASGKYTFLSSSVVREMARYGADLTGLVPSELIAEIETKAKQWGKNNG